MEKMEKLHVTLQEGAHILEIRQGDALPFHEKEFLKLNGTIEAPGDFLAVRPMDFPINASHVLVDEDEGWISLVGSDQEEIGGVTILGKLYPHPDFVRLGVNDTDKSRTTLQLASFVKMNRAIFESKDIALNLVSELRNFKAKINKIIEEKTDDRANYTALKQQIVESNIPDAFQVTMPLFVGQPAQTFSVEIVIDPDDFSCALISPDAADLVRREKKALLDKEISRFAGFAIVRQ